MEGKKEVISGKKRQGTKKKLAFGVLIRLRSPGITTVVVFAVRGFK